MFFDLSKLQIGQQVGVARMGSWNVMSQGAYLVKNVNKVRIVLVRESDGYERIFSMKTGIEKGSERFRSAFIESIEDMNARKAADQKKNEIATAWATAQAAANNKDLAALKAAVDALNMIVGQ